MPKHMVIYTNMDVKRIRARMGMTLEEFAHELGVSMTTVSRWENGHHKPSKLALAKLREIESDFNGEKSA